MGTIPWGGNMTITFTPIGYARTDETTVPRHWSVSEVEGRLEIFAEFTPGLDDITVGDRIVVLFHFHQSPGFRPDNLFQTPPNRKAPRGVFSICSPVRPNAIGMSVLTVLAKDGGTLTVRGIDMIDGTPILDIKPWITGEHDCPSAGR
jgi:tRNA-Thr(GGU) m(6)t(6)A37 methyltransferase TsaA